MTDPTASSAPIAAPKADPETLVLRAAPGRVTRFRRGAIVAIAAAGCVSVGLYPKQSVEHLQYILKHCEARAVFVGPMIDAQEFMDALPGDLLTIGFPYPDAPKCKLDWSALVEQQLERRKKGVMAPPNGRRLVVFIDDLSMANAEPSGAQPPIELLRQCLGEGGWFEPKGGHFKELQSLSFLAAMQPPAGGGRAPVSPRYLRLYHLIAVPPTPEESLQSIFASLLAVLLKPFDSLLLEMVEPLTEASVRVLSRMQAELLPTQARVHYAFSARDLRRLLKGISLASPRKMRKQLQLARLWLHESVRVFGDRLVSDADRSWLSTQLEEAVTTDLKLSYEVLAPPGKPLIFANFLQTDVKLRGYEDVNEYAALQTAAEGYLLTAADAKGGGSANKSFLFQATPSVLTKDRLLAFLKEKVLTLGTAACPPYHLAVVIGGTSAEMTLKTVKLASCKDLDHLPTSGNEHGRAFRDVELEEEIPQLTREVGIGAQFGGKYFCHDVRVIRLPRHGASCPVGIGVSCSADRQIKAKITKKGVFLEQLETDPARFMPDLVAHELTREPRTALPLRFRLCLRLRLRRLRMHCRLPAPLSRAHQHLQLHGGGFRPPLDDDLERRALFLSRGRGRCRCRRCRRCCRLVDGRGDDDGADHVEEQRDDGLRPLQIGDVLGRRSRHSRHIRRGGCVRRRGRRSRCRPTRWSPASGCSPR